MLATIVVLGNDTVQVAIYPITRLISPLFGLYVPPELLSNYLFYSSVCKRKPLFIAQKHLNLFSFTARPIWTSWCPILQNSALTTRLVRPNMPMWPWQTVRGLVQLKLCLSLYISMFHFHILQVRKTTPTGGGDSFVFFLWLTFTTLMSQNKYPLRCKQIHK